MSKLAGLVCLGAMAALSAPRALKPQGIQVVGASRWNMGSVEQSQALKLKGDPARGAEDYQTCLGCHQRDGAGQPDGVFPRLAGQHPQVVIKQLADIRLGRRDVPIMYPFAATVGGPQDLADLAAYVSALKPSEPNGRGPGKDLEQAHILFLRDCAQCHGVNGEGRAAQFFPRLEGQHYRYLLRQAVDIKTGARRNANPEMTRILRNYRKEDLQLVSDYASRLEPPPVEARR
jgi:cytochrome c553